MTVVTVVTLVTAVTLVTVVTVVTVVTEVVIMTYFSKEHLNTLTTDQLSGRLFATLAMF